MPTLRRRVLLALAVGASSRAAGGQSTARVLIRDVHILSPERLSDTSLGSVLIERGLITRVVRGAMIPTPRGATVVSGHGGYLIPGLIDSHVHVGSIPGVPSAESLPAGVVHAYFAQAPRSFLYYGYTTLIDLAVTDPQRLADFRAAPLHPDLYDCGPSLPVAGGYPMAYAGAQAQALYPNFLSERSRSSGQPSPRAADGHSPAAAIARLKRGKAICAKTYFERGFGDGPSLPVPSAELMAEVRRLTRDSGLVLVMHANSAEAQRFALDSHVDVIAHGLWNWGPLNTEPGLPRPIAELLDRIVATRTGFQPTIQTPAGLQAQFDSSYLRRPEIRKVIPPGLLAYYTSPSGRWFKDSLELSPPLPDTAMIRAYEQGLLRRARLALGYLAQHDANFLFGTDTPNAPTYGNLPGLNEYLEMEQLSKSGLSPRQLLEAATINNARAFGLDDRLGTIESGKTANLVLLHKSPLAGADAYDSIVTIWLHGRTIGRDRVAFPHDGERHPAGADYTVR